MAEAVVIREPGPPEVLRLESVPDPGPPGPGRLRLRQTAIGINFHDVYVRSGQYQTLKLPGVPGLEGVGVVEAVGAGVEGFAPGDRVAYLDTGYGAYASARLLDAGLAVRLPPEVDNELAATVLLKGLTAAILVLETHRVRPGETVLVHAAAGGVGRLLAQWAAHLGADVIGTAGSPEKAEIARAHGCREVALYREEDFAQRVMDLTAGRGADVVYDGVGRDTFDGSLRALAMRGHLVNYGQASGPIPPFEVSRLAPKSATLSRPGYSHYVQTRAELERLTGALFEALGSGVLKPERGRAFPLAQAADAHRALEAREAGPFILTV